MEQERSKCKPAEYEDLKGEYTACRQHLRSKEQALRIFQEQLKKADLNSQRLKQEIKQLRSQLSRSQQAPSPVKMKDTPTLLLSEELVQEKAMLIEQLEGAQGHVCELERQVQQVEDEKDELASEKDYYMAKCESLVKCLEEERKRQPPSHSALQQLLDENRELRLSLVETEAERDHVKGRVEHYKRATERRKVVEAAGEHMLTPTEKKQDLKLAVKRINELESLANSLSQSVKEKSVTIAHQKVANKLLATKVTELEHQVKVLQVSKTWNSVESATDTKTGCEEEVRRKS